MQSGEQVQLADGHTATWEYRRDQRTREQLLTLVCDDCGGDDDLSDSQHCSCHDPEDLEQLPDPLPAVMVSPDLFAPSPADRLRLGRNLANVQRLQSEFWQALRDLEESLLDITGETFELDGAKDFNDFDLADVLAGRANDGEEL